MVENDCYVDDDGVVVTAVEAGSEADPPQSISVRVGIVYYPDHTKTGVWIEYQEVHDGSLPQGPVLLTPAAWRQLSRAVNRHLTRNRRIPRWQRYLWKLTGGM